MNKKIKFQQLSQEMQKRKTTIPQHVSVTLNPDEETKEQIIQRQERFISLPAIQKSKLSSYQTGEIIEKIGTFFNLKLLQIASLARAVRSYYFGELPLEKLPETFVKEIGVDPETAQKIAKQLEEKIINDKSFEKDHQDQFEELAIEKAMVKYPKIKNQLIGESKIKIKSDEKESLPSVENWLTDYTFSLGYKKHNAVERSNYLFHSKNGLTLNPQARENLGIILKSFDEKTLLKINKAEQKIAFEKTLSSKVALTPTKKQPSAPQESMNNSQEQEKEVATKENVRNEEFNFHQKMPFEKKPVPFRITPNFTRKNNSPKPAPAIKQIPNKMNSKVSEVKPARKNIFSSEIRGDRKINTKNIVDLKDLE